MPAHVTRQDLERRLADVVLIEALPAAHYEAEHLPGARNLPGQVAPEIAADLAPDPSASLVLYCSGPGCGRSTAAAAAFERLGYTDVSVYDGGKADWVGAGLPTEASPPVTTSAGTAHSTP